MNTLFNLIKERKDIEKVQKYIYLIDDELNEVGKAILDIDETLGNLSKTLNELKEEGSRIRTSVIVNSDTGRVSVTGSFDVLNRRLKLYRKKLEYYCNLHAVLVYQIEAQRNANELATMEEPMHVDITKKPIKAGPHVNKLLNDFVSSLVIDKDSNQKRTTDGDNNWPNKKVKF